MVYPWIFVGLQLSLFSCLCYRKSTSFDLIFLFGGRSEVSFA